MGLENIRKERTDITDYVIHWANGYIRKEADEKLEIDPRPGPNDVPDDNILVRILCSGVLRPGFGERDKTYQVIGNTIIYSSDQTNQTIRGNDPAVCFTEQPLACLLESHRAARNRYPLYGIALKKSNLYRYGGRYVIYGDEDFFKRLRKEDDYLFVPYNPNRSLYPLDWTHEREWRCKAKDFYHKPILTTDKGVPLVLTEGNPPNEKFVTPYIIVSKNEERERLKESILKFSPDGWQSEYLKIYFERLPHFKIISLEEVEEHLQAGENEWGRIETIPFEESDNSNESENH